jgi:hypothetical protein
VVWGTSDHREGPASGSGADQVHAQYIAGLDLLSQRLDQFDSAASGPDGRRAFAAARDAYKRVEFLLEYVAPAAEQLNEPALARMEEDDPTAPRRSGMSRSRRRTCTTVP